MSGVGKTIKTGSALVIAGGCGWGEWKVAANGRKDSLGPMRMFWKWHRLCKLGNILEITELYILKQ